MAVDAVHGLYGVQVHTDEMGAAVLLGGITQQSVQTGTEIGGDPTSGEVYNRHLAMRAQKPGASFTTLAIAAALDVIGLSGLKVTATANPGLNLYAWKHAQGAARESGASHRKYNVKKGLIVPRTLSVDHQGDATLSYDVLVVYDGSNDPVVVSDSVSLPSGLTDAERFSLGPTTIESVTLDALNSFQVDFGIVAETRGARSDIWDTWVSLRSIQPVLTLRGVDVEWLKAANIPLTGKAATHANTAIYLRKRAVGAQYVADATAEHIKLTAAGLAYIDSPLDVTGNDDAETTLTMPLRYDGNNDPLVIDTSAAIT